MVSCRSECTSIVELDAGTSCKSFAEGPVATATSSLSVWSSCWAPPCCASSATLSSYATVPRSSTNDMMRDFANVLGQQTIEVEPKTATSGCVESLYIITNKLQHALHIRWWSPLLLDTMISTCNVARTAKATQLYHHEYMTNRWWSKNHCAQLNLRVCAHARM